MKRMFYMLTAMVAMLLSAGCMTTSRETITGTVEPVSATPVLGTEDVVIIRTPASP